MSSLNRRVSPAVLGAAHREARRLRAELEETEAAILELTTPAADRLDLRRHRREYLERDLGALCAFLAEQSPGGREMVESGLGFWYDVVPERFDLVIHLHRQREFSIETFGPGVRTAGVLDHIRRELVEVERSPTDLSEWIDVLILACDGAMRAGHEPAEIVCALVEKQTRNESRKWPDWRAADPDKAIEHVRDEEVADG